MKNKTLAKRDLALLDKSVSERSTKQEILLAYQELTTKLQTEPVTTHAVQIITKTNQTLKTNLSTLVSTVDQSLNAAIAELTQQLEETAKALEDLRLTADNQKRRLAEERDEEQKRREREEEEYNYNFKRQKTRQEEELVEIRKRTEAELAARKEELEAQQEELIDLRGQAKTFEARLGKAVSDAVTQATKEQKNQFEHEKALVAAHGDGTRNLLEQQVMTLQNTVVEQRKEIDRLNQMIIDASNQVTRIAERAVSRPESTSPNQTIPPKQ